MRTKVLTVPNKILIFSNQSASQKEGSSLVTTIDLQLGHETFSVTPGLRYATPEESTVPQVGHDFFS